MPVDTPNRAKHDEGAQQCAERETYDPQRMQIAAKGEFDEPCPDLRRSKQGANPDHSSSINTGTRENRQQVSREAGRDESVRGEC